MNFKVSWNAEICWPADELSASGVEWCTIDLACTIATKHGSSVSNTSLPVSWHSQSRSIETVEVKLHTFNSSNGDNECLASRYDWFTVVRWDCWDPLDCGVELILDFWWWRKKNLFSFWELKNGYSANHFIDWAISAIRSNVGKLVTRNLTSIAYCCYQIDLSSVSNRWTYK